MDNVFAELLREYRLAAGLTQETLAERAGLGVRSIQGLERGENRPQRDTTERLATALDLDAATRARFLAAATPVPRQRAGAAPDAVASLLAAVEPVRTNLPLALTSFVGRAEEIAALTGLLAHTRLLTLTGSGGVGKTRLALAVAAELTGQYPEGVWLVELAPLTEARLVTQAVLETLGTHEESDRPPLATLADYLQGRRMLLVLDNCEHLVAACAALVEAVLRRCPGVRVLATSREGLEVAGERQYRVPSLPVPDLSHLPPPERLAEAAAVALFVARARDRRADFALTPHNASAVAQICARLDGIPLAIELAAARVASVGVEDIAVRLDDCFRLLTGGPRTALPRQRTLRAALDWSYDLLEASEQLLLDRLSVFAGGWTLAAAEAVIGAEEGVEQERLDGSRALPCVGRWEVLDLLGGLVNKSLVQVEEAGGDLRYTLLETVRQYGQERLLAAGTADSVRDRHLGWCLALAEQASPHLYGTEQVAWLDRLEAEHDNLRAALAWAGERGAMEAGLRLAAAVWRFWWIRGHLSEGRRWLEAALAADDGATPEARVRALNGAGFLATVQGDLARGVALREESLAIARAIEDRQGVASSLTGLGFIAAWQGDHTRAMTLLEEALAIARELGDQTAIAFALVGMGDVVYGQGEPARAATLYGESVSLYRELGDRPSMAGVLNSLAVIACSQGDPTRAVTLLEEALVLYHELRERWGITVCLGNLGDVALTQGDLRRGAALHVESLVLAREAGIRGQIANGLEGLACVAAQVDPDGDPRRVARLLGAAAALRVGGWTPLRIERDRAEGVQAALGEEAFAAAWAEGQALPLDEAIALALEGTGTLLP
jgi:predicted ATPase/DNA-binding XRE family transcriptional regulator